MAPTWTSLSLAASLAVPVGVKKHGTGGTVAWATRTDQTQRGAGDRVTASNHILREAGPTARRRPAAPEGFRPVRARLLSTPRARTSAS
jgi:hypothetical protein